MPNSNGVVTILPLHSDYQKTYYPCSLYSYVNRMSQAQWNTHQSYSVFSIGDLFIFCFFSCLIVKLYMVWIDDVALPFILISFVEKKWFYFSYDKWEGKFELKFSIVKKLDKNRYWVIRLITHKVVKEESIIWIIAHWLLLPFHLSFSFGIKLWGIKFLRSRNCNKDSNVYGGNGAVIIMVHLTSCTAKKIIP